MLSRSLNVTDTDAHANPWPGSEGPSRSSFSVNPLLLVQFLNQLGRWTLDGLTAPGVCQMEMRPDLAVAPHPSPCPPFRLLPFFLPLLSHAFREQSPSWSSVNTPWKASRAYGHRIALCLAPGLRVHICPFSY